MTRDQFDTMEEEMKAAMTAVAAKHGLAGLEFDDYLHFWLEEHATIEEG